MEDPARQMVRAACLWVVCMPSSRPERLGPCQVRAAPPGGAPPSRRRCNSSSTSGFLANFARCSEDKSSPPRARSPPRSQPTPRVWPGSLNTWPEECDVGGGQRRCMVKLLLTCPCIALSSYHCISDTRKKGKAPFGSQETTSSRRTLQIAPNPTNSLDGLTRIGALCMPLLARSLMNIGSRCALQSDGASSWGPTATRRLTGSDRQRRLESATQETARRGVKRGQLVLVAGAGRHLTTPSVPHTMQSTQLGLQNSFPVHLPLSRDLADNWCSTAWPDRREALVSLCGGPLQVGCASQRRANRSHQSPPSSLIFRGIAGKYPVWRTPRPNHRDASIVRLNSGLKRPTFRSIFCSPTSLERLDQNWAMGYVHTRVALKSAELSPGIASAKSRRVREQMPRVRSGRCRRVQHAMQNPGPTVAAER